MADSREEIQKYVDEQVGSRPETVGEILDALATASYITAQHLAENWQDKRSASAWRKIAQAIERTEMRFQKLKPF